jgi:hypothetical protein
MVRLPFGKPLGPQSVIEEKNGYPYGIKEPALQRRLREA